MTTYKAVAESNNFIVLDKYTKEWQVNESFQSEGDLERELIQDLSNQGYEYLSALTTPDAMLATDAIVQGACKTASSSHSWRQEGAEKNLI